MDLKDEIETALRSADLEEPVVELELTVTGRIGGFVVSRTFTGMSQLDRQKYIWKRLDERLSLEQRSHIVALLTLTPEESEEPTAESG